MKFSWIMILLACPLAMGQIVNVNVGSAPNDNTGDSLRTAFTKINNNFDYVQGAWVTNRQPSVAFGSIDWSGMGNGYNIGALTPGYVTYGAFPGITNYLGDISYNFNKNTGDVNFGIGLENGFPHSVLGAEAGVTRDTEYYFYWNDPLGSTNVRIFQSGISWGPGYIVGGTTNYYTGRTYLSFQGDKFTVDPQSGLMNGGTFALLFGTNAPALMEWGGSEVISSNMTIGGKASVQGDTTINVGDLLMLNADVVIGFAPNKTRFNGTTNGFVFIAQNNGYASLTAAGTILPQQASAPTAAQIGGTVGSVTNHMLMSVGGALMDYWSDGTSLYSKQLAP